MFKKLAATMVALLASASIAFAGGAFQGYPLIGGDGATTCLSFGNNGVCNQFIPAGPNVLAPGSTVPADTNVQGAGSAGNPATVSVPAVLTGATVLDAAPLTATSITLPPGTAKLMLTPAGTIAALTIVLPAAAALFDGEELFIWSNQIVTALTLTPGSGTTVLPSVTTIAAAGGNVKLIYSKASTQWLTF